MTDVVILGCGPAGLMAAHACALDDTGFVIYSQKRKSHITGAQFLHQPLPGINDQNRPDAQIAFNKVGTKEGYARKVYGQTDAPVSWEHFDIGLVPAWSLGATYDALWSMYADQVQHLTVGPQMARQMLDSHKLVVSAIPAPALCSTTIHQFHQKSIWVKEGGYASNLPANSIIYSGDERDAWYRASNLFGQASTEFSHPVSNSWRGFKPLRNSCGCHNDHKTPLLRVGRFGRWERGVLSHDGFFAVQRALQLGLAV